MTVPSARGLSGHSDADVLLHAIADALFGALGEPDLGEQFPAEDARLRNADSQRFVRAATVSLHRKGWSISNVDATVIAEAPKLSRYKSQMARRIGQLLRIDASQVSVKAKSTEGFMPGRQGIAAQAVVLLEPAGQTRRRRAGRVRRVAGTRVRTVSGRRKP